MMPVSPIPIADPPAVPSAAPSAIPPTMMALSVVKPGRPPVLAMVERPTPTPAPGEVLLRVDACGFCHHDLLVMAGALRRGVTPGVILGHEIAATVVSAAADIADWQPGDRAVSLLTAACGQCDRCQAGREHRCRTGAGIGHGREGGFAEYVALPATALVRIPEGMPAEQAALLACPAGVALNAVNAAAITAGDTVVVTGAGGGLGVHAVQLAAQRGAQVIAATTSPAKTPLLESLGAAPVLEIDADADAATDLAGIIMALTDDAGADVVIDTVGPPVWPAALRCLGQYGRLALLGDVSGAATPVNLAELIFRDLRVTGISGISRDVLMQTARLAEAGLLHPIVSQTLPLAAAGAAEAWQLVAERRVAGRVVLVPPAI